MTLATLVGPAELPAGGAFAEKAAGVPDLTPASPAGGDGGGAGVAQCVVFRTHSPGHAETDAVLADGCAWSGPAAHLSVAIPCYNEEGFELAATLRSLSAQQRECSRAFPGFGLHGFVLLDGLAKAHPSLMALCEDLFPGFQAAVARCAVWVGGGKGLGHGLHVVARRADAQHAPLPLSHLSAQAVAGVQQRPEAHRLLPALRGQGRRVPGCQPPGVAAPGLPAHPRLQARQSQQGQQPRLVLRAGAAARAKLPGRVFDRLWDDVCGWLPARDVGRTGFPA